jgi:hypothetical protein
MKTATNIMQLLAQIGGAVATWQRHSFGHGIAGMDS